MTARRILIVEDVLALAESYRAMLKADEYEIEIAVRAEDAIGKLDSFLPSLLLVDVNLPDMSGLEILKHVKENDLPIEVVMMTARGSVQMAVDAMRDGAFDFIMKPFTAERLKVTVRNALERRKMANVLAEISQTFDTERFASFIGRSLPMQSVYRILRSAAPSKAAVFVTGESGTGKELCAEALHKMSKRSSGPLVAINCAAIPHDMLESEIFGHTKGAFTGAVSERKGAVLQANGGTLFLDEICEMDIALQAKMLRFLQTMTVQRLGDDQLKPVDVRIVCATNRDPQVEVAAGRFREDLFYRLHVVPIELPPLRERGDDVLLIANEFLERYAKEEGKTFSGFDSQVEATMLQYAWPGNVRQLQNFIRNIVVLSEGPTVTFDDLPKEITNASAVIPRVQPLSAMPLTQPTALFNQSMRLAEGSIHQRSPQEIEPLEVAIRRLIEQAIDLHNGSVPRAAAALGVAPSTIYRRQLTWDETDKQALQA